MITVKDFKTRVLSDDLDQLAEEVLLADFALHVSSENRAYVTDTIARTFGIDTAHICLLIVGSAKLGFSITEKRFDDGRILARYRPFGGDSDVDIAVVSSRLYEMIWDELSVHAHGFPWMPWNSGLLGDYMVYGWLRPDHFPRGIRLRRCDDWWDTFRALSTDIRFDRRRVRGGLFFSIDHLRRYQMRALRECKQAVGLTI